MDGPTSSNTRPQARQDGNEHVRSREQSILYDFPSQIFLSPSSPSTATISNENMPQYYNDDDCIENITFLVVPTKLMVDENEDREAREQSKLDKSSQEEGRPHGAGEIVMQYHDGLPELLTNVIQENENVEEKVDSDSTDSFDAHDANSVEFTTDADTPANDVEETLATNNPQHQLDLKVPQRQNAAWIYIDNEEDNMTVDADGMTIVNDSILDHDMALSKAPGKDTKRVLSETCNPHQFSNNDKVVKGIPPYGASIVDNNKVFCKRSAMKSDLNNSDCVVLNSMAIDQRHNTTTQTSVVPPYSKLSAGVGEIPGMPRAQRNPRPIVPPHYGGDDAAMFEDVMIPQNDDVGDHKAAQSSTQMRPNNVLIRVWRKLTSCCGQCQTSTSA